MPSRPLSFDTWLNGSRPVVPYSSEEPAEGPQIEVEVLVAQAERGLELVHALVEPHERRAEPLNLLLVEGALLHAPQGLALHQLPQKLHEGEDEAGEPALDGLRVGAHAARERVADLLQAAREVLHVAVRGEHLRGDGLAHAAPAKLYGAHGPVQTMVSSGWSAPSSSTRPVNDPTSSRSTR